MPCLANGADAMPKVYAVANGRRTGIFRSWPGADGAEAQVKGFPGAKYKGFPSEDAARAYLGGKEEEVSVSIGSGVSVSVSVKVDSQPAPQGAQRGVKRGAAGGARTGSGGGGSSSSSSSSGGGGGGGAKQRRTNPVAAGVPVVRAPAAQPRYRAPSGATWVCGVCTFANAGTKTPGSSCSACDSKAGSALVAPPVSVAHGGGYQPGDRVRHKQDGFLAVVRAVSAGAGGVTKLKVQKEGGETVRLQQASNFERLVHGGGHDRS